MEEVNDARQVHLTPTTNRMENSVAALTLIGLVARAPVIIKYRPAVCAMEPQGLNRLMREHNTNMVGQGQEVSVAKNKPLPG